MCTPLSFNVVRSGFEGGAEVMWCRERMPAAPPEEMSRGSVGWSCRDVIVEGPVVWMACVRWRPMISGLRARFSVPLGRAVRLSAL